MCGLSSGNNQVEKKEINHKHYVGLAFSTGIDLGKCTSLFHFIYWIV